MEVHAAWRSPHSSAHPCVVSRQDALSRERLVWREEDLLLIERLLYAHFKRKHLGMCPSSLLPL